MPKRVYIDTAMRKRLPMLKPILVNPETLLAV